VRTRAGYPPTPVAPVGREAAGPLRAADQPDRAGELLDRVVASIFDVGMILQRLLACSATP
jgi:hypothetical protein